MTVNRYDMDYDIIDLEYDIIVNIIGNIMDYDIICFDYDIILPIIVNIIYDIITMILTMISYIWILATYDVVGHLRCRMS